MRHLARSPCEELSAEGADDLLAARSEGEEGHTQDRRHDQEEESPDGYSGPRAASPKSGTARWRLLFQVDSEDAAGMMWGDVGRLYYWIRDSDLRSSNFENCWMVLQCS